MKRSLVLVLWELFRGEERKCTKAKRDFTQTFSSHVFYLNINFIFYIGTCLALMEAKHCPFDMNILKIVSYPKSVDPPVSLWHIGIIHLTPCLKEIRWQLYSTWELDSLLPILGMWSGSDRAQCQRLLLCWKKKCCVAKGIIKEE